MGWQKGKMKTAAVKIEILKSKHSFTGFGSKCFHGSLGLYVAPESSLLQPEVARTRQGTYMTLEKNFGRWFWLYSTAEKVPTVGEKFSFRLERPPYCRILSAIVEVIHVHMYGDGKLGTLRSNVHFRRQEKRSGSLWLGEEQGWRHNRTGLPHLKMKKYICFCINRTVFIYLLTEK